ncbi:MAG: M48 family metalloprotease [Bacteroidota bacterium]
MNKVIALTLVAAAFTLSSCSKDSGPTEDKCAGKYAPSGVTNLLISLDQDKQMGLATVAEIEKNSTEYPLLDSASHPVAYSHINRITKNILDSGGVYYRNEFAWRVRIIKKDDVLNAFCTPGGYIYVYTGLIKYLDNETQLAGVMGHEIAHADKRHSANQMVKQYGLNALISVLTGGSAGELSTLAANLLLLKYGRDDETEADKFSVKYLNGTSYDGRGAKYFFEKLIASGQGGSTPAFLSTHPNPDTRVADITAVWECYGSRPGQTFDAQYMAFKASLPN